ncbi:MAG TPA: hypothetical protein VIU82_21905 [Bosea sp. (in: a-proteobacteria)]
MNSRLRFLLNSTVARSPEGEGTPAPSATTPPADTSSILYGEDGQGDGSKPEGDKPAGEAKDGETKPDAGKPAWKEFEPDAAKSAEENAAAKAEHDKTKPAEPDASDIVPADGKYALTMPEGVEVDAELLGAVSPRFKELGLTGKQAQALTDDFIKVQQDRAAKQNETWGNTLQQWVTDAKADTDIGGDKWDGTVAASRRAVETLGTPALKEYLNASGGGNHPELIRFMAKVGSMIKEDDPARGGEAGKATRDRADVLYPDDKPKGT